MGLECKIIQCSYQGVGQSNADSCDLIVSTLRLENNYGKPMFLPVGAILQGIIEGTLNQQILEELESSGDPYGAV